MKPIKRWAIIDPGGYVGQWTFDSRKSAREANRVWYNGTGRVIRVEIREIKEAR